jgi:predicted O-methyltransferase YrrM
MKDIYSFSPKVKSLMKDSLSILMIYLPQEKLLNSILLMKKKLLSMLLDLKLREKVSLILEITVGIGISTKLEKIFI